VAIAVGIMHLMVFEKYGLSMPLSSLGFDNPVYHLLVKTPFLLLDHRYVYTVPLLNIVFALFLLLLIKRQGGGTVLKGKFIRSIGHLSYGIYIYHLGLSYLFTVFFKEVAEVLHFCKLGMFSQFPLMILYLLALFLLAQLSYSFFERLFLRMKKKYTIKNKVAVPST
jgi:peptidoglycan/LPS O-acetylase OafA/YrhL